MACALTSDGHIPVTDHTQYLHLITCYFKLSSRTKG